MQVSALECHSYMAVGMEYWEDLSMAVNCSSDARCQLIVEPASEQPIGLTSDCSNSWSTNLADCWNGCRQNVEIIGFVYPELCSYCCDTPLCNHPHRYLHASNNENVDLESPEVIDVEIHVNSATRITHSREALTRLVTSALSLLICSFQFV